MIDVACPYCGEDQEITHDDGYGLEENEIFGQECGNCKKKFAYSTCIIFHYELWKADCLNGANHQYEATITFPKKYTKMKCKVCGDERECSPEEMQKVMQKHEAQDS